MADSAQNPPGDTGSRGDGAAVAPLSRSAPPRRLVIRHDITLNDLRALLVELDRGNDPDGSKIKGSYLDEPTDRTREYEVRYDETKQPDAYFIDARILYTLLQSIRQFFITDKKLEPRIRAFSSLEDNQRRFIDFLLKGVSGYKDAQENYNVELERKSQKETVEWLLRIIEELEKAETTTESASIAVVLPQVLDRLTQPSELLDAWKNVIYPPGDNAGIVKPLSKASTYSTPKITLSDNESYGMPVFRKFLNKWIQALFDHDEYGEFFDFLTTAQKRDFEFDEEKSASFDEDQIDDDDKRVLEYYRGQIAKILKQIIAGLSPEEAAAERGDAPPEQETGGGEASDETTQQQEEQPPGEYLTIPEARERITNIIVRLVRERMDLQDGSQRISSFHEALKNQKASPSVFDQLLLTELQIRFADQAQIDELIRNPELGFFNAETDQVDRAAFEAWLDTFPDQYLAQLSDEIDPEMGRQILLFVFEMVGAVSPNQAEQDEDQLTATMPRRDESSDIAALAEKHALDEYGSLLEMEQQDFEGYKAFVDELRDSGSFLSAQTRLEGVLLGYLHSKGVEVASIGQLPPEVRDLFDGEIEYFLTNLTPAELTRLNDPVFVRILASRLNRKLLLGQLHDRTVFTKIDSYVDRTLAQNQAANEAGLNQILAKYGNEFTVDLDVVHSAENIDQLLTVEELNAAFGAAFGLELPLSLNGRPGELDKIRRQLKDYYGRNYRQTTIIQRLTLLYGYKPDFIKSLDDVEKLNQVLGLDLPPALTKAEITNVQDHLARHWELYYQRQKNKRDTYLVQQVLQQRGLAGKDPNSPEVRQFIQSRLNTSQLIRPLLSGGPQGDGIGDEDLSPRAMADAKYRALQAQLLQSVEGNPHLANLHLLGLRRDETGGLSRTQQMMMAAMYAELDGQAAAQGVAYVPEMAADEISAGQIPARWLKFGNQAQEPTGMAGRVAKGLGGLANRLTGKKDPKDKAVDAVKKKTQQAATSALAAGANAFIPGAGAAIQGLAKAAELFKKVTGISYKQMAAIAAVALTAIVSAVIYVVSRIFGPLTEFVFNLASKALGDRASSLGSTQSTQLQIGAASEFGFGQGVTPAEASGGIGTSSGQTTQGFLGTYAGNSITTFASIAIAGGVLAGAATNAAFLLPTVGSDRAESRFVTIQKFTEEGNQFENEEFNESLTYNIIISPKPGYDITITNITDTMRLSFKANDSREGEYKVRGMTDFGLAENDRIPLTEPIVLTYSEEFSGEMEDVNIINTFQIELTAIEVVGETTNTYNDTATTGESVCVGDCPQTNGCWPASGLITQIPGNAFSHPNADAYDIAANVGSNIYAPFSGDACRPAQPVDADYGIHIILRANNGHEFLFGHLSSSYITADCSTPESVDAGKVLGAVGSTGNSTGSHLHYEVAGPGGNYSSLSNRGSLLKTLVPDGQFIEDTWRGFPPGEPVRSCYDVQQ